MGMNKNFDLGKPVVIGSDHAGFQYKAQLVKYLEQQGYKVIDKGTYSEDSVDYPDYAHLVANTVESNEADAGILLCGSGNGVCMTANKHAGIRAALCWTEEIAMLARQHNDANIICIPARFITYELAEKMIALFLTIPFEGGRHERRVEKI